MADRRIITLNPIGYHENLQSSDRLVVESPSAFRTADFAEDVTFTTATYSGNVTIQGTPSSGKHAVTVDYLTDALSGLTISTTAPIQNTNNNISIDAATEVSIGALRFATDAEASSGAAVDAAVKPDQLLTQLGTLSVSGTAPIVVTETADNQYLVDIDECTNSQQGSVRFSTDLEATTGSLETAAINPKQLKTAIENIPDGTSSIKGLVRFATGTEALNGVLNDVAVTPAQLDNKIDVVNVTANLPLVSTQFGPTWDLDINDATESTVGVIRIATDAEANTGTATDIAINPKQLEARLGGVTITDATTTVKGILRLATDSEVLAGVTANEAVTPASMRYAFDNDYVLDGGTY